MGLFKRAGWHSGLTYRQTCDQCRTTVEYMDDKLDFRPWFPDGFVYCPKCQKPLRHNERYAINAPQEEVVDMTNNNTQDTSAFCSNCGAKFRDGDNFCAKCGNKR